MAYWNNWTQAQIADATGYPLSDVQALFSSNGIGRFANGGYHAGGARIVGENGPELAITGPEYIFNARQTSSLLQGSDRSDIDLAAQIEGMKARLAELMQQLIALTASAANATLERQDRMISVTEDGAKQSRLAGSQLSSISH